MRAQYANDFIIGDWVLSKGYAFASTDKGNTGAAFYRDGSAPGGSIARVAPAGHPARPGPRSAVVRQAYGAQPERTYMAGISNGGYLTRWQLENNPQLFDGGARLGGHPVPRRGPEPAHLPADGAEELPGVRRDRRPGAHDAIIGAGFAPGSEFLWAFHHSYYWDLTQRIYREELDPTWDGALDAGVPFCASGTPSCDADYDYASRPGSVKDAVRSISLTGRIRRR